MPYVLRKGKPFFLTFCIKLAVHPRLQEACFFRLRLTVGCGKLGDARLRCRPGQYRQARTSPPGCWRCPVSPFLSPEVVANPGVIRRSPLWPPSAGGFAITSRARRRRSCHLATSVPSCLSVLFPSVTSVQSVPLNDRSNQSHRSHLSLHKESNFKTARPAFLLRRRGGVGHAALPDAPQWRLTIPTLLYTLYTFYTAKFSHPHR